MNLHICGGISTMIFHHTLYNETMINIYTNTKTKLPFTFQFTDFNQADIFIIEDDFTLVEYIYKQNKGAYVIYIDNNYNHFKVLSSYMHLIYLVKPLESSILNLCFHELLKSYKNRNKRCILLTTHHKIILNSDDLIYFETSYKHIKVVTTTHTYESHISNKDTLMTLIDSLNFIKINKSLTINKKHILYISQNTILLKNHEIIDV